MRLTVLYYSIYRTASKVLLKAARCVELNPFKSQITALTTIFDILSSHFTVKLFSYN